MEATAVLIDRPMESPLIPEIAMSGLELLTEVLMEVQPAAADAIIKLPLPDPLPPEEFENNGENNEQYEEKDSEIPEQEELVDSRDHQPVPELLPLVLLNEHAAEHPEHSEKGNIAKPVSNNGVVAEYAGQGPGGDIAAYFALEFLDMQYIYYLQRSAVSLGRSSNDENIVGADIDLGPLKNISRLHARIEYEEELERFVLAIIGRNGAYVDGTWKGPGTRIPLGDRTLIQISTRAFYFILPHSSVPSGSSPGQGEDVEGDHEVPALDSTVTTAEDEDESHSTSASATPKQVLTLPRRRSTLPDGYDGEEEFDLEDVEDPRLYGGKGKGKGKGKDVFVPAKRGRGRPRKNSVITKPLEPSPIIDYADSEGIDIDAEMLDFSESGDDDRDDGDGDFIPKKTKGTARKGKGGLGKTRSTGTARPPPPPKPAPVEDDVDELMSEESHDEGTQDEDGDLIVEDGVEASARSPLDLTSNIISKRNPSKRKREGTVESAEGAPPEKRRKNIIKSAKPSRGSKKTKASKSGKAAKEIVLKGRKKSATKPEMKSLFTTTPAPALSVVVAASVAAEAAASEAGVAAKAGGKKGKTQGKKGKKEAKAEKGDNGDDEKAVKEEEEAKPTGPPPPKPPFTYPLLCYRALKALDGKAAYRAITKWLESEYPYFAAATKEGKDGWENSTRHTLSSHRAFIKIDRKPEERGKGCFWSFDPEFEEQFKDQWRAAESQARNPRVGGRPPNPPPGSGPNGHGPPPGMYPRPPFGQPGPGPGWSGVTPPHLMPGYRPMVPGAPPGPYPFPPGVPRPPGMLPHPPMHPHPLGMPPPPSLASNSLGKARAPKKPKQALGAAFSRAPLIRPGLGGVPAKGGAPNGTGTALMNGVDAVDEAVRRGEHVVRMAARAAKDELSGRAPPGTTLVAATGGWGMGAFPPPPPPPMGSVNGTAKGGSPQLPGIGTPARPSATTKIAVVLSLPPAEALPPHFFQPPPSAKDSKPGPSPMPENGSKSPEAPSTSPAPKPPFQSPIMPMTFFKGTLFLDPSAYPYLEDEDVSKMGELGIGDAMQYLLTRSGSRRTGPSSSARPVADDLKKLSESPERDVKAEEGVTD